MKKTKPMYYVQKVTLLCVLFLGLTAFAETVSFQYGDSITWNGELGQTVAVEYKDRGQTEQIEGAITKVRKDYILVAGELIFITDIVKISGNSTESTPDTATSEEASTDASSSSTPIIIKPVKDGALSLGVFILPMEGMVGETMRATELKVLAEYIDENYGPGQVIVLKINSGGGISWTWSDIKDVIFKVRETHRVIAWVESAISAAAMTALCCDEIYYTSFGECGSCTGWRGSPNNPSSLREQNYSIDEMKKVLARSSRTPFLAACMVLSDKWLTYDKNLDTGEITYYDSDEGEFALSTGTNLTLTAKTAFDAGLCDGIADTQEELLTLLKLEDADVNLYGVELFEQWEKTIQDFKDTIDELGREFDNGDDRAKTQKKLINSQIKAGEKILKWAKKLGEVALYNGLDKDRVKLIKRQILDLRMQLQTIDD